MLQSRSHLHPLVAIPQQGSQISLFGGWHPDIRKVIAL
jgi:hypothetical protein